MSREQPTQITLGSLPSNIAQFMGMFVDHLIERLILLICTVLTILGVSKMVQQVSKEQPPSTFVPKSQYPVVSTTITPPPRVPSPSSIEQGENQQVTEEPKKKFSLMGFLGSKKKAVESALEKSIVIKTKQNKKICESMRYSLLAGGKRIRPILCLAACEMFGGNDDMAMPTAVALEMIHTMSLIHDDLPAMDNDSLRRGKPTNHVVYGEDIAILAGDALLSTAFQHVACETPKTVSGDKVLEVIKRLGISVGADGLAGGQVMDLECEGKDASEVTLEDLEWIHIHKTAALLQVAVAAGAILAGASEEDIKLCEEYAIKIGLAFQIADDILDVTATTEELGKTAGKDEEVNKATYVKLLGLERSKIEAARLIKEAKSALSKFGDKAFPLCAIADFIVARSN